MDPTTPAAAYAVSSFSKGLSVLGEFSLFMGETVRNIKYIVRRRGLFLRHCEFIGVSSIGVITVAALFMGSVLGYQLYVGFHRFGMESLIGGSVGVTLYRELAPVMAAVMVIGRSGASMAAELASMRISEQIDALEVMAIDPVEYLVTPRVLAGLLMMPILAMLFCVVASYAAAWVSCGVMGLDYQIYWTQYIKVVDPIEITHCLVKGATFGLLLTWVACFYGFRAHGGARAVGLATRNTVVAGCLAVLFSDYLLTSLLPFGFTYLRAN